MTKPSSTSYYVTVSQRTQALFIWVRYKHWSYLRPDTMTQESQSNEIDQAIEKIDKMADHFKASGERPSVEKHGYNFGSPEYELLVSTDEKLGVNICYTPAKEKYAVVIGVWGDGQTEPQEVTDLHGTYDEWESARHEFKRLVNIANHLSYYGCLTRQQAVVYQYRDVYGVSRGWTADLMDISESMVHKHRSDARDKIRSARETVVMLD